MLLTCMVINDAKYNLKKITKSYSVLNNGVYEILLVSDYWWKNIYKIKNKSQSK